MFSVVTNKNNQRKPYGVNAVDHQSPHQVVIIGGGFGGLYAAKALGRAPVNVTLVDKRNFHLFQPPFPSRHCQSSDD